MGFGDDVMAIGHAEAAARADPQGRPVAILDRYGRPQRSPLWEQHPGILVGWREARGVDHITVTNGPGARPYIRYPFTSEIGLTPSGWRARDHRGTLHLPVEAIRYGEALARRHGPFVIVGADTGRGASPNKEWGWDRYVGLVRLLREQLPTLTPVRLRGPTSEDPLPGCEEESPSSFVSACGAVAAAEAYVGAEGGLHHAAAYLGTRAVVLFGHFISPEVTGYPEHVNLTGGAGGMCGSWIPCEECERAMDQIHPGNVVRHVRRVLSAGYNEAGGQS